MTQIAFHFHLHLPNPAGAAPAAPESGVTHPPADLKQLKDFLMEQLELLKAAVQRDTDVTSSAVTFIREAMARIEAAANAPDPAALQAVIAGITANTDALAAAIVANTPAAPPAAVDVPLVDPAAPAATDAAPADQTGPQ